MRYNRRCPSPKNLFENENNVYMMELMIAPLKSNRDNCVVAFPRKTGAIKLDALESKTQTQVRITLNRLKAAELLFVSVGQKYGFNMTNVDLMERVAFFLSVS